MISSPRIAAAACVLAFAALPSPVRAQVLAWKSGMATSGSGESTFTAVETAEVAGSQKVFLAGNAQSNFLLGGLGLLSLPSRPSGVVVGARRNGDASLASEWQSRAQSSHSVVFTDLEQIPGTDQLAVCGHFEGDVTFKDSLLDILPLLGGISLSPGSGTYGFVALIDRKSGNWKSAFVTPGILPQALTCDAANSVLLTGDGTLAARFSLTGALAWKIPVVGRMSRIAAVPGSPIYVLGEETGDLSAPGVTLHALNPASGSVLWSRQMGGPGIDSAGGLAVDSAGQAHVAFRADFDQSAFAGVPIPVSNPAEGDTVFAATISADGTPRSISAIARPGAAGSAIDCRSLALDDSGGSWIACSVAGTWQWGDASLAFPTASSVVLHLDSAGDFHQWLPGGSGNLRDIALDASQRVVTAGDYAAAAPFSLGLPTHSKAGGVVAILEKALGQELWVSRPNAVGGVLLSVPLLRGILTALGATVYAEIDVPGGPQAVSFWGTPEILAILLADPRVITVPESYMQPSSTNAAPGWGLARVGGSASETAPYVFPDTNKPVRLYLIDTAVANPSNWIGANPKLTLEKSVLIRGSGDPTKSSEFKHGTEMLSLIGGMETGAAAGVPIQVVSYDVYPQGGTTSTTLLAKAVTEAVKHYRAAPTVLPAAICIATSSTTPATSYTLQSSIQMALSEGIPVIVSAGNLGATAASYIPAAYGTMDGVICTGSSDRADVMLASSNRGATVDLLAPGLEIRTLGVSTTSRFELMTGTSPAAGLVTAIALNDLSLNGKRTAASVEAAVKSAARLTPGLPLLQSIHAASAAGNAAAPADQPDGPVLDPATPVALSGNPAAFPAGGTTSGDADGDGVPDLLEIAQGSDPAVASASNPAPRIELTPDRELHFTFPISKALFDGSNPFTLLNGCTWRVRCSSGMTEWDVPIGGLSKSTDAGGQV